MRPRDTQKRKLYNAENEAFKGAGSKLESYDLAKAFIERVWRNEFVRSKFPIARNYPAPRLTDGRGTRRAFASLRRINLPLWARNDWCALHEIAHSLQPSVNEAVHGWQYAERYLILVQHFMGRQHAEVLKAAFKKYRVRYRPKRKLSAETLARLRERGAALAAKRDPQHGLTKDAREMLDYLEKL